MYTPIYSSKTSSCEFQYKDDCSVSTFSSSDNNWDEDAFNTTANNTHPRACLEEACQESTCSELNQNVLQGKTFNHSDNIALTVDFHLARKRDAKRQNRVNLAKQSTDILQNTMKSSFTGSMEKADLVLMTRVILVSDGNALTRTIRGKKSGHGLEKLTVAYCLFSRKTGEVVIAKQLSCVGSCSHTSLSGRDMVREISAVVGEKISTEISNIVFSS